MCRHVILINFFDLFFYSKCSFVYFERLKQIITQVEELKIVKTKPLFHDFY